MHIFAVANQKGGVGKTTTSVNLAAALAANGQRTLLVDLDPQGNATMGCGVDKRNLKSSVYQVLLQLATLEEARVTSPSGKFDVLPANRDLAGAEVELVDLEAREMRLKSALAAHKAGQLGVICVDGCESLDAKTFSVLEDTCSKANLQMICTRVTDAPLSVNVLEAA